MRIKIFLNGQDVTNLALLAETSLGRELDSGVSQLSFSLSSLPVGGGGFPYTLPLTFGAAGPSATDIRNMYAVRVEDLDGNGVFGGFVTRVDPVAMLPSKTHYKIACQGWAKLLDNYIVSTTYTGTVSDQQIIEDLLAAYADDFDTTNVELCQSYAGFTIENKSIRSILDDLASYSGANWYVDADKRIWFDTDGFDTAPWSATYETPATEGEHNVADLSYSEDFADRANQVTVRGGADPSTGELVVVTVDDAESQAQYGQVFPYTINDSSIASPALATIYANAELDRRSQPKRTGSFRTLEPGLEPGQLITITTERYGLNGVEFLIRSVSQKWISPDQCEYSVEFGDNIQDLTDFLKSISDSVSNASATKPAYVPNESITGDQLAAGVLNSLAKFGPLLRPIVTVATLPALPNAEYPGDSYVFLTTNNKIYRNVSGTWTESTAPVGTYVTYNTGLFQAENMIGAVVSNQIANVSVTKLYGTISSGGDVAIDAGTISGTFAAGSISIHGSNIQNATIPGSAIISITQSQITSLSISDSQIIDLSGAKIKTLTVPTTALANGSVTNIKIADVSVDKFTAGEANFTGTATFRNGNNRVVLDGTAVQLTNLTGYVRVTSGGIYLYGAGISIGASSGTPPLEITSGGDVIATKGTSVLTLNSSGLQVAGGQIGLGAATFGASPFRVTSTSLRMITSLASAEVVTSGGVGYVTLTGGSAVLQLSGTTAIFSGTTSVTLAGNVIASSGYIESNTSFKVGGLQVVGSRQSAVGDPVLVSTSNAGATYTSNEQALLNDLKSKLNDFIWNYRSLLDKLGSVSGHGLIYR